MWCFIKRVWNSDQRLYVLRETDLSQWSLRFQRLCSISFDSVDVGSSNSSRLTKDEI